MNATRERPILMQGDLVRATIERRKWQTRRPLRKQIPQRLIDEEPDRVWRDAGGGRWGRFDEVPSFREEEGLHKCPFGPEGYDLWVRETWMSAAHGRGYGAELHYRADGYEPAEDYQARSQNWRIMDPCPDLDDRYRPLELRTWRPSIHMPRWACRLVLPNISVRVERLQDINEEDAIAEGFFAYEDGAWTYDARAAFARQWDQIYGDKPHLSWDSDPWVWVVEWDPDAILVGDEARRAA